MLNFTSVTRWATSATQPSAMTDIPLSTSGRTALDVARDIALHAGGILLQRFDGDKNVRSKGRADIVTDVDFEVEAYVLKRLAEEFPDHGHLAEETGGGGRDTSPFTWIVDPLDGTRNYAIGVPFFATTLALAHHGEVVVGVTYDPMRKDLFVAEKGRGAFLNDEPIHTSARTSIDACTLGTDMGYDDEMAGYALQLLNKLWPGMQAIRIMGSAALGLAYAASGRMDLYFHHHLAPWDIAAGILLGREAGAVVTNKNGEPIKLESPNILAASPTLHAEFLRLTEGLNWRGR